MCVTGIEKGTGAAELSRQPEVTRGRVAYFMDVIQR